MSNLQTVGSIRQSTYRPYTLVLEAQPCHNHHRYSATVRLGNGETLAIKILPIYRSGTTSLTNQTGSARVEVVLDNPHNSWKLFELVYTHVISSKHDLGRAVLNGLSEALQRVNVLPEHQALTIQFKQENILRSISA